MTPTSLNLRDTNLKVGENWKAELNFDSIIMSDGSKLTWADASKEIIVTGNVDTEKPGNYKVTYNYRSLSKTATITVESDVKPQELIVKDSKLKVGSSWEAKDNFESILMSDGSKLSWEAISKEMIITDTVDTKKAGTYKVTYNYRNLTKVATITVESDIEPQELMVKDSKLKVGSSWEAKDNFEFILMSDGSKLSWEDVSKEMVVTDTVDTKKAGTYKVTYNYRNLKKVATITVESDVKAKDLVVKNSTILVGDQWTEKDNFEFVLMSDGSKLSWEDVAKEMKVTGKVDSQKEGTYKVTYNYREFKKVAIITVKSKNEVTAKKLVVKNSTIFTDSNWHAKDNFDYILMSDGSKLLWKDVEKEIVVSGKVNTQKAGTYKITYNVRGLSKVAEVTVKNLEAKSMVVKDSTISLGSKWHAKDNFNYLLLSNGSKLTWEKVEKEIIITGEVNTQKVGTYKVTYDCKGLTKVATITVKQSGKPGSGTTNGKKPTVSKPTTSKPTKYLPKTGEVNNSSLLMIGVLIISGTFIGLTFKLKKETN
ncbi:bacterial Ig-like domain-containing protein [Vagococcus carniphilus]|uniref:bacterial Ig-like domain-containing protein n=1 Tax=Vagococcus carniphilus TaxID=218144 RepID=UPI003B59C41E